MTVTLLRGAVYPDTDGPRVECLAIDGERVLGSGAFEELRAKHAGATVVDLGEAAVVPGFVDGHHHLSYGVVFDLGADCRPAAAANVEAICRAVAAEAAITPPGEWVTGYGFDERAVPEGRAPTLDELSAACPEHPLFLMQYSVHEALLNRKALDLLGVTDRTPDPDGGRIERDRRGRLTGRMIEAAAGRAEGLARASVLARKADAYLNKIEAAQRALFPHGITRLVDTVVPPDLYALYLRARDEGRLLLPLVVMPVAVGSQIGVDEDYFYAGKTMGDGDDLLRVGPVKFVFDGAQNCAVCLNIGQVLVMLGRTLGAAWRSGSPRLLTIAQRSGATLGKDLKLHSGVLEYTPERARQLARRTVEHGHGLAIHAIGNVAFERALDAIEDVKGSLPKGFPPRIEHGTLTDQRLLDRAARLGVAICTQPAMLQMFSEDMEPQPPGYVFGVRAMLDAGIAVGGSSDYPAWVVSPLDAIRHAVLRRSPKGRVVDAAQAVTVREALTMYTKTSAELCGSAHACGTLDVGKRADFVVLSADPIADDAALPGLAVEQTWLGGRRVHPT